MPPVNDTYGKSVTKRPVGPGGPATLPPPDNPTNTACEVSLTVTVRCTCCDEDCDAVTRTAGVPCACAGCAACSRTLAKLTRLTSCRVL